MTFQEAYERTRKVLNIIIPFGDRGRAILMNFLTTPNVVGPALFTINYSLSGLRH